MVSFTGLSPETTQVYRSIKHHISLPDVEVAVAQSDHASISIKGEKGRSTDLRNLTQPRTVPCLSSQQL